MLPLGCGTRLPLDVLHFLGDGLALTCHSWRSLYIKLYPDRKTAEAVILVTVPLLAWARDVGYALTARTARLTAQRGQLEALH
jgi:hypothetical protein